LAKLGHKVALIDISQAELDLAAQHAEANNVTLEAFICADASTLRKTLPNSAELLFDAVLIFGPLYHLLEKHERLATVSNCAALLKPNGIIAASFLTKFGHLRGVARNDSGRVAREETFYQKYLEDGKYDRKRDVFSHHTHPDEIHKLFGEVTEFELRVEKLVACESFLGSELAAGLNKLDENEYQAWEKILLRFAEDPYVLGASEHILVIGRRA
jgi:S-adenosylmethionine-dependent methyltransferase